MAMLNRGNLFGFPFPGNARKSAGQSSELRTEYLEMNLDHDSGAMSGRVLKGGFEGRELASMTAAETIALWQECRAADPQSAALIEAYLDRSSPDWRDGVSGAAARGGPMSRDEALKVLELAAGASEADIRTATPECLIRR